MPGFAVFVFAVFVLAKTVLSGRFATAVDLTAEDSSFAFGFAGGFCWCFGFYTSARFFIFSQFILLS